MFTMRKIFQASVLRVCHLKNGKKFITTTANGDNKPYPLDGIRVLDLTRIGKTAFFLFKQHNFWQYKTNKYKIYKQHSTQLRDHIVQ